MSPLVLEQPALDHLHAAMVTMLRESDAKCAVLVDQDGQCITKKGFTQHLDTDALAALVAGSFASTRAMAHLVGENEFTVLFHQGEKDSIHNVLVDDDTILSVIFDDRTTIGMVRLYSKAAAKEITGALRAQREALAAVCESVDEPAGEDAGATALTMGQAAADKLDSLFGDS
jgi:predicted regulator of Ras-like GTPase activity (Roadblock/LC7/MglB family)